MLNNQHLYKENISFKSIFYFCSLPLRLDSYKGCTHNCLYCFSQNLNNRKKNFFKTRIKPGDPKRLERLLKLSQSNNSNSGVVQSCLRKRIPIHLGGVSDPFQPAERKYKVTLEYLKILSKYNYPVVISTKGTFVSDPEYLSLLKSFPSIVQYSFSTLDDNFASLIEPGAPLPSARLKSLQVISDNGIWASIRLQPFLFPLIKPGDINFKRFANAGGKHLILEHLRIPTNTTKASRQKLFEVMGFNVIDEYKKFGIKISRINFELRSEHKIKNILAIRELVNSYGMTFGCGDNDFHHFSDMPCCCGLPNQREFQNYYKGHLGYSAFESMKSGIVHFDNVDNEWQPIGSITEFVNSDCRINGVKSVYDYLKYKIQNPGSSNSPTCFAGFTYNKGEYQIEDKIRKQFDNREKSNV